MKSYQKTPTPLYISELGNTMPEILDKIKETLDLKSDQQLADSLGFEYETIREWRRGITWPSKTSASRLKYVIESRKWGDSKCQKDIFLAYNTVCFDSVKEAYEQIATIGDAIAMSSATHSLLSKIAFLIENGNNMNSRLRKNGIPVQKMHCVFGLPDYGEVMNVQYLDSAGKFSQFSADILIKIALINGRYKFVYQVELIFQGKVDTRFAGIITDKDIDIVAKKVLKHITKKMKS